MVSALTVPGGLMNNTALSTAIHSTRQSEALFNLSQLLFGLARAEQSNYTFRNLQLGPPSRQFREARFKKFLSVNQQFDRLALDPFNVRDLDMTDIMIIDSLYDKTPSIDTETLSKICPKLLPRIHRQVHKLTVEQCSMKDILLAANYSELYSLSLINFQVKILYQYLRGILFHFIRFN
ncbi:unnamed protein product [Rotaria sp. Silwood1]|nr:unnamed protein product [Rotaria sp. Silwood1]CAF1644835.1 unnamed protein product [Rotaria sp. Silwood1]CAF3767770.1 unnamed protein product [Rotaria sp. Silwood1]CAF3836171.1 unnamed protein product [Rotaria sp. Silwood1]CAF4794009.1 unnamed protein product [Rotaria sp. Silwood1]